MLQQYRAGTGLLAVAALVAACDSGPTDVHSGGSVALAFSLAQPAASSTAAGFGSLAADDLVLAGTNGTLTITDIRFLLNEFKLERSEAACEQAELQGDDHDEDDDDSCREFESGVEFIKLPLSGSAIPVVTENVPAGTYTHVKFEVEDVEFDDVDDEDAGELADIRAQLVAAGFTDWPEQASMVVVGTFTPTGGTPRPFRAYFEAEIKVEMGIEPPLQIADEGGTIDVEVDPRAWFAAGNGALLDLSALNYATTHQVVKFESKLEDGFSKIELEGFDDD